VRDGQEGGSSEKGEEKGPDEDVGPGKDPAFLFHGGPGEDGVPASADGQDAGFDLPSGRDLEAEDLAVRKKAALDAFGGEKGLSPVGRDLELNGRSKAGAGGDVEGQAV